MDQLIVQGLRRTALRLTHIVGRTDEQAGAAPTQPALDNDIERKEFSP